MELNRNLDGLRLGGIRRFNQMAAEEKDCVLLTLGEPQAATPQPIVDACTAAMQGGATHYTENRGTAALRAAIVGFERDLRGLSYTTDEVIVTAGATEAIYAAITGVVEPGDEVIIPAPAFSLYETVTRIAGGKPVLVDTSKTGFLPEVSALRNAITERTKLLVLNSPNNPTGMVYPQSLLDEIAVLVKETGIFVLSDDVYWGLGHCPTFSALTALKDQILSVQSFSKPYAMTGWRIGYLMADSAIIGKLNALHAHLITCCPAMIQTAAVTALTVDTSSMGDEYRRNRDYAYEKLTAMGLPTPKPEGAFYLFPSVAHLGDDTEVCEALIRRAGVALVPGSVFGTPGHARLSCCCGFDRLRLGLDRLERFIHEKGVLS